MAGSGQAVHTVGFAAARHPAELFSNRPGTTWGLCVSHSETRLVRNPSVPSGKKKKKPEERGRGVGVRSSRVLFNGLNLVPSARAWWLRGVRER